MGVARDVLEVVGGSSAKAYREESSYASSSSRGKRTEKKKEV